MLYAILSDLHANESAFRRVLADAKAKGAQKAICLGDVVGYGPLPEETASLARIACAQVIAGNHDDAVSGRLKSEDFNDLAADAVQRHRAVLSSGNLDWLRTLGHTFAGEGFIAAHGDFTEPESFHYIEDEMDAEVNFKATDAQLMFVGHTHQPAIFLTGHSGKVYKLDPTDFAIEDGKRYIVNPGSVGYPRDHEGTCQSSYVLYDSSRREVTFHSLPFSVSSVMQRGKSPRKVRKALLVFAAAALTAAVIAAGLALYPKNAPVKVQPADSLVLSNLTLKVSPEDRHFCANLILGKKSATVLLCYRMNDKAGNRIKSKEKLVSVKHREKVDVPRKADTIDVTLSKNKAEDSPVIIEFNPVLEP